MAVALGFAATAAPVAAQQTDDFCPARPGQTTPPCVVAAGGVIVETALATLVHEQAAGSRTRQLVVADTVVRLGLAHHVEAEVGWAPATYQTVTAPAQGGRTRTHGASDTHLGIIVGPTGNDGRAAFEAGLTLPTGHAPIGAQTWSAETRLPLALPPVHHLALALTPEVDATPNDDGAGHHASVGAAGGVAMPLSTSLQVDADVAVFTDLLRAHHATARTAGLALAWHAQARTQFDVGATVALSHREPEFQIYAGLAHAF
ncbi:MAG: transporter [Vicinamibacterales bacterium]